MAVTCPSCNRANPERYRLCVECGTPLSLDSPPNEIRRFVTVVTSDLKGSTALGERLDPESLREVLTRYFDEMRVVFESHGGTIEKIIGDAIVAVFGMPTRRDDDAVRAIRAAAESVRVLNELNDRLEAEWGVRLTTRTGVATGDVIVGEAMAAQHVLTGDTMKYATAMEQNSPPLEVLVAASTYELVRDLVEVEELGSFTPKGLDEPTTGYRLLAIADRPTGPDTAQSLPAGDAALCPTCGEENPTHARLCGMCGSPIAAARKFQETRKTVSIVFADPKPTTETGEPPSPEALRDVMSRYFDEMRRVLEHHGGTVEKFIGDAVMAVFGLPVRHEDDALRAVRAALGMQEALPPLNEEFRRTWGVELLNHIGVNTGEVVAGDASLGQRLVTGDAVNVSARLEQAAHAREVLIGPLTYRLVRDAVDVQAVEPLTLKGKSQPVPAYRLLAVRSDDQAERRQDAPMVGRDAEMALLRDAFRDVLSRRACRTVTIVGDAGVGKTRLTREFLAAAGSESVVLKGRCLPYGDGITFWPMVEIVRAAAQLREDDTPEDARTRILETVGARYEDVAERIESLIGLSTSTFQVAELFWAIRRFFELLARKGPLVVVIDDIHWAEQTFLDLLEDINANVTEAPLLVLCTARNELLEEHASWAEGERQARIVLSPLSDDDAEAVIRNLLGQAGLNDAVVHRVTAAAEGNPLFVEQLLSMLMDSGQLRFEGGVWTPAADLSEIAIPPTIHALVASRLDSLPADERSVVEPASVIGLTFAEAAVEELVDEALVEEVPVHLDGLARRQLIRPAATGATGADAWRFQHLVIRDAAYQGLLKRSRAILHERFVEWADRVNEEQDRALEFEEILGYHLEQAYRYRTELGPLDEHGVTLGIRAAERLGSAGERASARGDLPAASNLLARAVAVLPAVHPTRPRLLVQLGQAKMEMGEFEAADSSYGDAIASAVALGSRGQELTASLERLRLAYLIGSVSDVQAVLGEVNGAIPELERAGEDEGLARAWRLRLNVEVNAARWAEAEQATMRMLEYASRAGNTVMQTRALANLAMTALYAPTPVPEAIARCEDVLLRAGSDRRTHAVSLRFLAWLRAMRGEFDLARGEYQEARRILVELGWNHDAAMTSLYSGPIELLAGDPVAAETELRLDYEAFDRMGDRNFISTTSAYLAEALYRQGRLEEAEHYAGFAQEIAAEDDPLTQILWRATRSRIAARGGRADEAVTMADEAVSIARGSDDLTTLGDAILSLAEVLWRAGRQADGSAAADEAIATYELKGNEVAAARARELAASFATPPSDLAAVAG